MTTAIAIALSGQLGGMPDLTAVVVIMTGILGAMGATSLLDLVGIKCWRARGLATGVAAHGIGTARILAANELGGAVCGPWNGAVRHSDIGVSAVAGLARLALMTPMRG